MNQENGVVSKTLDEMYQEYIDSLHLVEPQLSDYHLTEELISQIENTQAGNKKTEGPKAMNILKFSEVFVLEYDPKTNAYSRLKFSKDFVGFIYGFIISAIIFSIIFLQNPPYDDFSDNIVVLVAISLFGSPFGLLFILLLTSLSEYIVKILYSKKHLQNGIAKALNDFLHFIMRTELLDVDYQNYKKALKEYHDAINNLKIVISWKDVVLKDGVISCCIQIFKRSFDFKIPRSLPEYDNYRIKLMNCFPELYFKYNNGTISLYTDRVNKAIDIIIAYIEEEAQKERQREQKEKERKEREERERQEREKREEEERESERREKEKLMNGFYSSHPYFKNEHDKQDALRTKIKVEKSKYLNYLMEHQLDGIDIMSVREDRRTASMMDWQFAEIQNGYVFILKMNAAEYCVIYENVFDNNASIKYINSSLLACLEAAMDIKLHMQSKTPNKRDKITNTRRIGEHRVRRIMHDDFHDWKQKLHSGTFR